MADHDPNQAVEQSEDGRYIRYDIPLGSGAFKDVYKGFDEDEMREVAWNRIKIKRLKPADREKLRTEVSILQDVEHPNIINFYTSWIDPQRDQLIFITEVMTSGTLKQYLLRSKQTPKLRIIKKWSIQILKALEYLHQRKIIHRDIKCDNIFINGSQGQVKVGDLGLSTIMKDNHAVSVIGTPEFMAPELYDENYNEKVDIYAFGMCVLEMVTQEYPFSECENPAQIFKRVTAGGKPGALSRHNIVPDLHAFISLCIESTPTGRLSAKALLKHPFLKIDENGRDDRLACQGPPTAGVEADADTLSSTPPYVSPLAPIPESEPASTHATPEMRTPVHSDEEDGRFQATPRDARGEPQQQPQQQQPQQQQQQPQQQPQQQSQQQPQTLQPHQQRVQATITQMGAPDDPSVMVLLRLQNSDKSWKEIEFPFDLQQDTADEVALEMVEQLELPGFEDRIAQAIRAALYSKMDGTRPSSQASEADSDPQSAETGRPGPAVVTPALPKRVGPSPLPSPVPSPALPAPGTVDMVPSDSDTSEDEQARRELRKAEERYRLELERVTNDYNRQKAAIEARRVERKAQKQKHRDKTRVQQAARPAPQLQAPTPKVARPHGQPFQQPQAPQQQQQPPPQRSGSNRSMSRSSSAASLHDEMSATFPQPKAQAKPASPAVARAHIPSGQGSQRSRTPKLASTGIDLESMVGKQLQEMSQAIGSSSNNNSSTSSSNTSKPRRPSGSQSSLPAPPAVNTRQASMPSINNAYSSFPPPGGGGGVGGGGGMVARSGPNGTGGGVAPSGHGNGVTK